jgi:phage FluMu protein Com
MEHEIPKIQPRWSININELNNTITLEQIKCRCGNCESLNITYIDSDNHTTQRDYYSGDKDGFLLIKTLEHVLALLHKLHPQG